MAGKPRHDADMKLAEALARGESVERAATLAGVSSRTAFRRLQEDDFWQLVTLSRSRLVRQVGGRLAASGDQAVETLVDLLADEDGKLRLGAARAVLEHLFKASEVTELAEQVEALRRQMEVFLGRDDSGAAGASGPAAQDAGAAEAGRAGASAPGEFADGSGGGADPGGADGGSLAEGPVTLLLATGTTPLFPAER